MARCHSASDAGRPTPPAGTFPTATCRAGASSPSACASFGTNAATGRSRTPRRCSTSAPPTFPKVLSFGGPTHEPHNSPQAGYRQLEPVVLGCLQPAPAGAAAVHGDRQVLLSAGAGLAIHRPPELGVGRRLGPGGAVVPRGVPPELLPRDEGRAALHGRHGEAGRGAVPADQPGRHRSPGRAHWHAALRPPPGWTGGLPATPVRPRGGGAMSNNIIVTRYEGWAELRIDHEDKRNAMDRANRQGLMSAFESLRNEAKAIVITGAGGSFCAGIDLKELAHERERNINTASEEWIAVNLAIRAHPAIFVAAVNGIALGGGSTLINVCDLAVASTKASIGTPEMGFSTYPGMAGPA